MVKRFVRSTGAGASGALDTTLAAIQERWIDVVGPAVDAKARPVRRSHAGVVTVACVDAMWAQTLSSQTDVLLDRLRAEVDDEALSGLKFVPDEHAFRRAAEQTPPPPVSDPVTPEKLAAADRLIPDVSDPVLRELLVRAAARAPGRADRPKST
jgi:Dna[CI] antecedent, DciA